MTRGARGFALWLTVIAVTGFALRVAYVVVYREPHLPFGGDPQFYSGGANLLAAGRGFIQPLSFAHIEQSAGHPPLYLLWLTLPSLVWPHHHATQLVHLIWTCVLGTGSIVVIGLAGREILSERVGLLAAAFAAVYPNLWVQDGMLRAESAAIFVVALMILLAYRFVHRPTMWRLVWLGVACGLGALARTELLLAVPLLLVPLVLVVRGVGWQRKIVWMVAGGVAALIVIAPWVGYNMTRFNAPVTISTNAGGTLAAANCRSTYYGELIGYKDYGCALRVWIAASKREPNWKHFDEAQKDRAVQAESKRYIDAHLTRLPVVVAARWGRILSVYQPFQEVRFDKFVLKQEWSVGYSIVWTFWLFTLLAAAGVAVLHRRKVPVWPLLAFPVIVFISVGLTFAQTRYRVPAEVAMVLLAAVAVDAGFARFRSRRAVETDERGETSVLDLTALEAPDPEVAASAGSPTADRR